MPKDRSSVVELMPANSTKRLLVCGLLGLVCLGLPRPAVATNYGYVTVSGTGFMLDGCPYFFAGANLWQGMNLGMRADQGGDRPRLGRELDRLRAAGIVNLRVMASSEGPDTAPYRMVPSLQPAAGVFNESVFEGLDYLLQEMNLRGMRAVMQLNNYWHWSGGMAQYVSWAEGSRIPYPPSYPQFVGNWSVFMNYAARFYANATCQSAYRTCIRTVVERTNSLTGVRYKDDPTIFAWELANEPRLYPAAWIDDSAAYIKSLDARHLVTVGSEGEMGGAFVETHNNAQIDYATCHVWPQNWGWYDPLRPETYAGAMQDALAYVAEHEVLARTVLGKPLVVEEFGLARDAAALSAGTSTAYRDGFFDAICTEVASSAAAGGALAGENFWAWAGEGRSTDPAPRWIGDPPHETPGWYSVYDTDAATLTVLAQHAAQMAALSDDSDRDELPDSWESASFGSTTNTSGDSGQDWDRDGATDRDERAAGTAPANPADYLAIRSLVCDGASSRRRIAWNSVPGRLYTVTVAPSLLDPFVDAADFQRVRATGSVLTYTNSAAPAGPRFYRITVHTPW